MLSYLTKPNVSSLFVNILMREQTITFFTKAHFWFFFFQNHAWKLGVRLIHECGLYTSFYGIWFFSFVVKIIIWVWEAANIILMRIIFEQSIITYIIFFSLCTELSQWLIENKLVEHLFGPNLHVEVIW